MQSDPGRPAGHLLTSGCQAKSSAKNATSSPAQPSSVRINGVGQALETVAEEREDVAYAAVVAAALDGDGQGNVEGLFGLGMQEAGRSRPPQTARTPCGGHQVRQEGTA